MAKNIGGIWKRRSRAGNDYFFVRVDLGALGKVDMMAIVNKDKTQGAPATQLLPDLILLPWDSDKAKAQRPGPDAPGQAAQPEPERSADDEPNIPF